MSDPRLDAIVADSDLPQGWRGELSLEIPEWIHRVASALVQGCLLCFDYVSSGYGPTLLAYSRHVGGGAHWLDAPGKQDISSHIDLSALFRAATEAGLQVAGCVDQTYFLTALGCSTVYRPATCRRSVGNRRENTDCTWQAGEHDG